jgi:hypothetical protein
MFANGFALGDVADLVALFFILPPMLISSTTVQITTAPAISANVLLWAGLLFFCVVGN